MKCPRCGMGEIELKEIADDISHLIIRCSKSHICSWNRKIRLW
jgi:hypothetical protein